MQAQEIKIYSATKTASDFHQSDKLIKLSIGAVGCGKSVSNCIEIFRRALEQEPGSDGMRRSRWAIIRNTYPELKKTTIKTWQDWFPEHQYGKIKWDSPPTHRIQINDLDLEVIFLALDSENAIGKLMSFELTGVYINELQFIHPKVFTICLQRIRRYPGKNTGAKITWAGIIADTNPPSTRHWIYELFEKSKPENAEVFKFAPALIKIDAPCEDVLCRKSLDGSWYKINMEADYIQNIPDINYWIDQVPLYTDEEIKVYLLGQYGIVISGKAVHPEYNDRLHYASNALQYNSCVELGLGWDFGLTPACAITQFTPSGKLIVLAELYSEHSGLRDFVENIVLPFLNRHYPGWKSNYVSRHDPAGQSAAQTDARSCQDILKEFGIFSLAAAQDNSPTPRREGLKYHLRKLIDGEPAFLLDPSCMQLREGLMGQYQYAKIKDSSVTRYHEKPLKNEFSHICEALEYIAMYYAMPIVKKNEIKKNNSVDALASYHYHLQHLRSGANIWR